MKHNPHTSNFQKPQRRSLEALCAFANIVALCLIPVKASTASFVDVYRSVKPSVVMVVSSMPAGAGYPVQSGSGFIVQSNASSSTVITANHVIEGAESVDVILDSNLKERYPATIVLKDHVKDVAILRIGVGGRKALSLLDPSRIEEGMSVAVVGYPRAVQSFEEIVGDALRPTVHMGIVSAVRLNGELIQFDAATDHGDSGGPVIDVSSGRVVAIVRGAQLDVTYASRGIEQALPGSFYGPSSATIGSVLHTIGRTAVTGSVTKPSQSSAAYRVGFVSCCYTNQFSQTVGQPVLDKLTSDLQKDNSFYLIPVSGAGNDGTSEKLLGFCQDNRLNAIMYPRLSWTLTGGPVYSQYGTYYTGRASAQIDLVVTDCAGEVYYFGRKEKSEDRYFANRAPDREVSDMLNDLEDQLVADFSNYRSSHQGAWDTLMKYGLPIDPSDSSYHSMFYAIEKNGNWQVFVVFPGGPADQAGIKTGDVLISINGTSVSGLTMDQIESLMNSPSYTVVIQRPGGDQSLTVHPWKYQQLISNLVH